MQQSAQQSVTVPPAHPFLHQPFDNVHRLKTMSVLGAQEWQRKYNQHFKVNETNIQLKTKLHSSLPFLSVFMCSAKPDTIFSSGGKDTCFSPLLLFFWFLLGFSASSSLCSSLSLQRVIPPFRTLIAFNWSLKAKSQFECSRASLEAMEKFLN